MFFSQSPLHEGRCNRIFRSGCIQLLTRTEGQMVRRIVNGHRIRPGHRPLFISNQKKKIFLQLIKNSIYPSERQL